MQLTALVQKVLWVALYTVVVEAKFSLVYFVECICRLFQQVYDFKLGQQAVVVYISINCSKKLTLEKKDIER